MTGLREAMELLELVENRKYDEAVAFIKTTGKSNLEPFVRDLIYKVAHSVGNELNHSLHLLLRILFDLLNSTVEKYRICYDLFAWRTSPYLTEIVVDQFSVILTPEFERQHTEAWKQVCEELPAKVEQRLLERLLSMEELCYAVSEITQVLAFFENIPHKMPNRFRRLVDNLLEKLSDDDVITDHFLRWYAKRHPFSPRLVGCAKSTVLIPQVYNRRFLQLQLVEGVCDHIINSDHRKDGNGKLLEDALRLILKLLCDHRDVHAADLVTYMDMFILLLKFTISADREADKSTVLKLLLDILIHIPAEYRMLLLRNAFSKIVSEGSLLSKNKTDLLSFLLDHYQQNLSEKAFTAELGSIFGLLEDVAHEDVRYSCKYFLSLLGIIRTFSSNCVNVMLLTEVRGRIVLRIANEVLKSMQSKNDLVEQVSSLQLSDSDPMLNVLLKECKDVLKIIDAVLERRQV